MKAELETEPTIRLRLIRATDDPPLINREYQKELADFSKALRAAGIQSSSQSFAFDGAGGGGGLSGEFILKVVTIVGPPLITGLAGWLTGRSGRKFRVKVGEIEVEGSTTKEAEDAVARLQQVNSRR